MNHHTRRHFLKHTSLPVVSTLLNLNLAGRAAAENAATGGDQKTLVCFHLNGGMDGFNLLVPRDAERHAEYAASRSNLHLPLEGSLGRGRDAILPLTESDGGNGSDLYGLHASCPGMADMFNGSNDFDGNPPLSFIGNVGTLIKPLTTQQFFDGEPGIDNPVGIGGHFRQTEQWHTSIPQGTINLRGWLGRAADITHGTFNRIDASMNISLAGNNLMQSGDSTRPFSFNRGLSNGLTKSNASPDTLDGIKNLFHRRMLGLGHENLVDKTFAETSTLSLDKQVAIREAVTNFDRNSLIEAFSSDSFGRSMENAIALISARAALGLRRQTIFIQIPGWDDHFELPIAFGNRIKAVSTQITCFQKNLNHLGLADSVIGFSTSEFARTLRSTGAGSDHAWGGPQFLMGGPIQGGKVLGNYPRLQFRSEFDTGRGGRFLPSTGCDEYFAEILRWFGVSEDQLRVVLPNYHNFQEKPPIGAFA